MHVNLVLCKKNGSQKTFALPSTVTVIGRRSDCDLYIPAGSVSKRHCQLSSQEGQLKVRDLGSRNGTYVNGERVEETVIKAGDRMKIGPVTFIFQIDGQPEQVSVPKPAEQQAPKSTSSPSGVSDDDFDLFEEFEDLDSAEAGEAPDDFDFLDDPEFLEESGSS